MRRLHMLRLRLRSLFRHGAVERELQDELAFHFDALVREMEEQGLSPAAARAAARRTLGGPDQIAEAVRDTWRVRAVRDGWQDLRYGARVLARAPGFTAVAVLTLALGIGAPTAIFSIVNGVLLKPLPYPDSGLIVSLLPHDSAAGRHISTRLSGGDLVDLRESARTLDAVSYYWGGEIGVGAAARAEITSTWFVSPPFFRVLGTPPLSGRTFLPDDEDRAAVVTAGYAARQFGGASAALGRKLEIDGRVYEIVGVMPPGFAYPAGAEVWVPVAERPENLNRTAYNYQTIARIRAGVPPEAVAAELDTIGRRLQAAHPDSNRNKTFVAVPLHERMVGPVRATLVLLMGAVALLWLIACANVANLLLARASARSREIALRAALGASRWRVVRQLLAESLLLAIAGGALGLLLAHAGTDLLLRLAPADVRQLGEVDLDGRVLAFGLGLSVFASLMFGLAPAWQASGVDVRDRLAQAGARSVVTGGSHRTRTALAVTEIAVAVVLATGAGLLFRSFIELNTVDMGFRTEGLLVMRAHLPTVTLDDTRRAVGRFERLFPDLAGIPGVVSVSATVGLPMSVLGSNGAYAVDGKHTFAPGQELPQANFRLASPGYFRTMGVPLVRGRDFSFDDTYDREFVAIISESLAAETFPGEDPIGRLIRCGLDSPAPMKIVGVVADFRGAPHRSPAPELYMPIAQHPSRGSLVQMVIRTAVDPASVVPAVQRHVEAADPEIATRFTTMEAMTADAVATPRFRTWLVGAFAALALLLATAGVYGLISFVTAQRTPELGVRLALGATPATVMGLVLGRAALIAAVGLALGTTVALAGGRLLSGLLFGIDAFDGATFAVVLVSVLIVSLGAAAVPAWRASRIDPLAVLREN